MIVRESDSQRQDAARHAGAQFARGKYLGFVRGGDRLAPVAVEMLVESLEQSGSDFGVGRASHEPKSAGGAEASAVPSGPSLTIDDAPQVLSESFAGSRLFRRKFWREVETATNETWALVVVRAALRATAFDVLADVTCHRMQRGSARRFGSAEVVIDALAAWADSQRRVLKELLAEASASVVSAWAAQVLDTEVERFIDDAERADEAQWRELRDTVRVLAELAGHDMRNGVRAEVRVKVWLAQHDRRTQLEEFVVDRLVEKRNPATETRNGLVYARFPFYRDESIGIPDECFALFKQETALIASVHRLRWVDGATVKFELLAYVHLLDLSEREPDLTVRLVHEDTGMKSELTTTVAREPAISRPAGQPHQNYDRGLYTVSVCGDPLVEQSGRGTSRWHLEVVFSIEGIERTAGVIQLDPHSHGGLQQRTLSGFTWGPVADSQRGLRFEVNQPVLVASTLDVDRRTLRGRFKPQSPPLRAVLAEHASGNRAQAEVRLGDHSATFELALPGIGFLNRDGEQRDWTLQAIDADGSRYPVTWTEGAESPQLASAGQGGVALRATESGDAEIVETAETPHIDAVDLLDSLVLRGHWLGSIPKVWTLRLRHNRLTIPGSVQVGSEDHFQVTFSLGWDEWGLGEAAVPTGAYHLELVIGDETPEIRQHVLADRALAARSPEESLSDQFRMRVRTTPRQRVVIHLGPPLADDEIGPFNQRLLQEFYARNDHAVDENAVCLQAYVGESATDSPLAVHQALRQVRPDLVLYWCVADSSMWVPEGAVPVLMRSRRWYEVLASSRYLVNNIVFDRWFQPRPHQRVLQTFHGYPSKAMGVGLWESKLLTPRRIQRELERTAHTWDVILTPTPEMDQYYRREFRYQGQILSLGYPRDDVLKSPDAPLIRAATRSRFGIRDDQTAVLYAPTWRDDAATNHRSARMVSYLDLEGASRDLGDDFVLFVRGHRFHARESERTQRTARVVDVTDYPEINDLILAVDVAILDYSSLRFDFAITGKPMLFLVPDLEYYEEGMRGFLFDYRVTAPGPLMSDTAHAVSCLKDLAGVVDRHADEYSRFNATYNYLHDGAAALRVVEAFFV